MLVPNGEEFPVVSSTFLVKAKINVGPIPKVFPQVFMKSSDQHIKYEL